jgi:hypothetical protein
MDNKTSANPGATSFSKQLQVGAFRTKSTKTHAALAPHLAARLCKLVIVLTFSLAFGLPSVASAQEDDSARESTEFQAADLSKHKEDLSGIPFMVGAYMIIWGGLFVYLRSIQKRTDQVGSQVRELQAALKSHDDAQRDKS